MKFDNWWSRVIVSPHKIRLSAPKEMFHLVFTAYERRNPLRFFQYSGIIMPFILSICLDILVIQKLRNLIGPVDVPFNPPEDIQPSEAYKVILYPKWPELGKSLCFSLCLHFLRWFYHLWTLLSRGWLSSLSTDHLLRYPLKKGTWRRLLLSSPPLLTFGKHLSFG